MLEYKKKKKKEEEKKKKKNYHIKAQHGSPITTCEYSTIPQNIQRFFFFFRRLLLTHTALPKEEMHIRGFFFALIIIKKEPSFSPPVFTYIL